jgi:hypothetical protein
LFLKEHDGAGYGQNSGPATENPVQDASGWIFRLFGRPGNPLYLAGAYPQKTQIKQLENEVATIQAKIRRMTRRYESSTNSRPK